MFAPFGKCCQMFDLKSLTILDSFWEYLYKIRASLWFPIESTNIKLVYSWNSVYIANISLWIYSHLKLIYHLWNTYGRVRVEIRTQKSKTRKVKHRVPQGGFDIFKAVYYPPFCKYTDIRWPWNFIICFRYRTSLRSIFKYPPRNPRPHFFYHRPCRRSSTWKL